MKVYRKTLDPLLDEWPILSSLTIDEMLEHKDTYYCASEDCPRAYVCRWRRNYRLWAKSGTPIVESKKSGDYSHIERFVVRERFGDAGCKRFVSMLEC